MRKAPWINICNYIDTGIFIFAQRMPLDMSMDAMIMGAYMEITFL